MHGVSTAMWVTRDEIVKNKKKLDLEKEKEKKNGDEMVCEEEEEKEKEEEKKATETINAKLKRCENLELIYHELYGRCIRILYDMVVGNFTYKDYGSIEQYLEANLSYSSSFSDYTAEQGLEQELRFAITLNGIVAWCVGQLKEENVQSCLEAYIKRTNFDRSVDKKRTLKAFCLYFRTKLKYDELSHPKKLFSTIYEAPNAIKGLEKRINYRRLPELDYKHKTDRPLSHQQVMVDNNIPNLQKTADSTNQTEPDRGAPGVPGNAEFTVALFGLINQIQPNSRQGIALNQPHSNSLIANEPGNSSPFEERKQFDDSVESNHSLDSHHSEELVPPYILTPDAYEPDLGPMQNTQCVGDVIVGPAPNENSFNNPNDSQLDPFEAPTGYALRVPVYDSDNASFLCWN
jgi:hypothetical protein